MFTLHNKDKKPRTRSLALVLLAWVFIGGQALLAAGSVYDYNSEEKGASGGDTAVPWTLISQGANRVKLVAMQAKPDIIGNVAIFLAVANALGLAALVCGLLSWSRSSHTSGKLTMAAAVAVVLVNSILILPCA
jgi:hypothetical protein